MPTESAEQRIVVDWCHAYGIEVFAVPNGLWLGKGKGRFARISAAKAQGMLPGAPDLVLVDLAPASRRPVALELKRAKGGRLTSSQVLVHSRMSVAGWHIVVAHGADEAIDALRGLGYGPPEGRRCYTPG